MAKRKVLHPEAREKLAASLELLQRAIEGGILGELSGEGYRKRWTAAMGDRSRAVAAIFRGVLAPQEGVRVLCDASKWATRGIWLELDVPGGRLFCPVSGRTIRHAGC